MRAPPRSSVAASVARQAAAASSPAPCNDVVSFDEARPAATRIEAGIDGATGRPFLKAIIPEKDMSVSTDLSFLIAFSGLREEFSKAFLHCGLSQSRRSRAQLAISLEGGILAFLRQQGAHDLTLAGLTRPLLVSFVAWLDAPRENGQPWAHTTRSLKMSALRTLLNAACEVSSHPADAIKARNNIPDNPWPGSSKKNKPRARLSREHLGKIIAACESEVLEMVRRFTEGRELIATGLLEVAQGNRDYRNPAVCLAKLSTDHPTIIPFLRNLRSADPSFASVIKKTCGVEAYDRYLYASSRDLVPLAILIAVSTAFNADTVLLLEWAGIKEIVRLGVTAFSITGPKNRAKIDPVILDGSGYGEFGIGTLLGLLRVMTDRVRDTITEPASRDRVFVFVTTQGSVKRAKAFGTQSGDATSDASWRHCLQAFIERHGLQPFTLSQIRPTIVDEAILITGDVMAGRSIAQHRSVGTTWHHYTSDGTKRRFWEKIGEILVLRERWQATNGQVDPRSRAHGHDVGAATPGFLCLDPHDSPRPNQQSNRLCTAYGECPSCPLSAANVGDPAAVASYQALQQAIFAAQGPVTPHAWLTRWAPVAADLDDLLRHVPKDVLEQASQYKIRLPPVG